MAVVIDLRAHLDDLSCAFCGESMDSQGNDPWELLLTSHYCADAAPAAGA